MIFNQKNFHRSSLIFLIIFISSSTATSFCSNLTAEGDITTPCFLESPLHNPVHLRTSANSLILPCHVARSKQTTVEWWYQDFQKSINVKIYPVFPPVRPTALRFTTAVSPASQNADETDIIDVSILLRFVNVDDKGIYRCVIRSWGSERFEDSDNSEDSTNLPAIVYHVDFTGPRLCQQSLGSLPCFTSMLTTSPTYIDAYQTTFLQCVVRTAHRPVTIFWVVGNASENSVLITDHLTTNKHKGDRLHRVFPLSPFDYSIELTINRDVPERTYSCVIDGATNAETTLFTYIVRSIKTDSELTVEKVTKPQHNEIVTTIESELTTEESTQQTDTIPPHDALTAEQVDQLRKKTPHQLAEKKEKTKHNHKAAEEDDDVLSEFYAREDKSTRR